MNAISKKILIIDDDTDLLELMEEALAYEGFEAVTTPVTDGYEQMIRQNDIGLVIIDYLLGGVNGGEICHQIKSSPEFCHLPVVIYSAYPKVLQSLGRYGCDVFIPKPFDLVNLVDQITRLLGVSSNNLITA